MGKYVYSYLWCIVLKWITIITQNNQCCPNLSINQLLQSHYYGSGSSVTWGLKTREGAVQHYKSSQCFEHIFKIEKRVSIIDTEVCTMIFSHHRMWQSAKWTNPLESNYLFDHVYNLITAWYLSSSSEKAVFISRQHDKERFHHDVSSSHPHWWVLPSEESFIPDSNLMQSRSRATPVEGLPASGW